MHRNAGASAAPWAGDLVYAAFSGSHQDAIRKSLAFHREHALPHWTVRVPADRSAGSRPPLRGGRADQQPIGQGRRGARARARSRDHVAEVAAPGREPSRAGEGRRDAAKRFRRGRSSLLFETRIPGRCPEGWRLHGYDLHSEAQRTQGNFRLRERRRGNAADGRRPGADRGARRCGEPSVRRDDRGGRVRRARDVARYRGEGARVGDGRGWRSAGLGLLHRRRYVVRFAAGTCSRRSADALAARQANSRRKRSGGVTEAVRVPDAAAEQRCRIARPLVALTSLFFMWGLITSLNDILIPHLKAAFTLTYVEATLIQLAFFGAYFVMSMPSGWLVEQIGYKRGIIVGLLVAAVGCAAVLSRRGRGDPIRCFSARCSCSRRASRCSSGRESIRHDPRAAAHGVQPAHLTQAFNSLGTTIGPYVGATLILAAPAAPGADAARLARAVVTPAGEAALVQSPYSRSAAVLFVIAMLVRRAASAGCRRGRARVGFEGGARATPSGAIASSCSASSRSSSTSAARSRSAACSSAS